MISYYSAVFLTALLMLGLLMYAVRKKNKNQKYLVLKVVGLTTGIALLLPTLLNNLTMIQTGLLMALLAALAGALVPVVELLPQRVSGAEEETATVMKVVTEADKKEQHQTAIEPMLAKEDEGQEVLEDEPGRMTEEEIVVEEETEAEPEEEPEAESEKEFDADKELETEEITEDEEVIEVKAEELTETEEEAEAETDEETFAPGLAAASAEEEGQRQSTMVLPDTFSETMAEVMLMNGYLALKDDEEDEAIDSFGMVCQRASVIDQRMMAYMELKQLMPEVGKTEALIQLAESLLSGKAEFTPMQRAYIEKHTHYLKRLVSLLNAHGVTLEQPYSAMPDELKEMAMTYQE